jgi:hypothetical protein
MVALSEVGTERVMATRYLHELCMVVSSITRLTRPKVGEAQESKRGSGFSPESESRRGLSIFVLFLAHSAYSWHDLIVRPYSKAS